MEPEEFNIYMNGDPVAEPADPGKSPMDIDHRVAISLAVGRYLRSAERFKDASDRFTEACDSLRNRLGKRKRFVVQIGTKNYLVTSDRDGNFDVEFIESV